MVLTLTIINILLVAFVLVYQRFTCPEEVKVASLVVIMFFFMAIGPSISYLMGAVIYFGIRVDYIDEALIMGMLVNLAIIISHLGYVSIFGYTKPNSFKYLPSTPFMTITGYVLLGTSMIMLLLFFANLHKFNLDKVTKVSSVAFIHYKLVLLWMAAFSVYFSNTWKVDRTLIISFCIFVIYAMLFDERDFIFIIMALLFVVLKAKIIDYRLFVFGFPAALAATSLTADRGEMFQGGPVSALFNQGSNLFINSFIIEWVDNGNPKLYGETYVSSMLDSISFGKLRLDDPLAEWFVGAYTGNPDADAGYGFSLEAEAFLNFGYEGVFILFFLLGLLMVHSSQKAMEGRYLARLHVMWVLIFMIYGLRGESLNIMKPYLYCWVIILLARILTPMMKKRHTIIEPYDNKQDMDRVRGYS